MRIANLFNNPGFAWPSLMAELRGRLDDVSFVAEQHPDMEGMYAAVQAKLHSVDRLLDPAHPWEYVTHRHRGVRGGLPKHVHRLRWCVDGGQIILALTPGTQAGSTLVQYWARNLLFRTGKEGPSIASSLKRDGFSLVSSPSRFVLGDALELKKGSWLALRHFRWIPPVVPQQQKTTISSQYQFIAFTAGISTKVLQSDWLVYKLARDWEHYFCLT